MRKISKYVFVILFISSINLMFSQKGNFAIKDGQFLLNGKAFTIYSGEMHYPRIPSQYWKHRLQMMKAMGLNTVTTYVFWNYHEESPGKWNFSGEKDLKRFIKTAQEVGLYVIIRPGPYVCAEWEFGGYPWWLQKDKSVVIRTDNEAFLKQCENYINQLARQIVPLEINNGGPVIMVQAENEFGSYVSQRPDIPLEQHRKYSHKIKDLLVKSGISVPFFTSDGSYLFKGGAIDGVLPTANGEGNIETLKKSVNEYNGGKGPYMVAEYYPGWLDHWAEPFVKVSAEDVVKQTEIYIKNGVSFNYYMIHGGTNFGFTSGANYDKDHDIQPDITSYDYDAPISEAGWATPKYNALRNVFLKINQNQLPEVPKPTKVITIPDIKFSKMNSLFDWLEQKKPIMNVQPLTFEDLNIGNGYVLYRRKFDKAQKGTLEIKGLRDYANIYVNGNWKGELNRINKKYNLEIEIKSGDQLDILVENMGRINYGADIIHNLKGIISPVKINGDEISGNWQMFPMTFDEFPKHNYTSKNIANHSPVIQEAEFNLGETGDTFLDMRNFGKGIVFINGKNLGRYWSKAGPQQTLYVPGVWLKKGKNTIQIFEQIFEGKTSVNSIDHPILDQLVSK
ncbi:beta-galactosidase [Chryseobacterium lactis]|uniref:Beta-galactosidase n=1 Tax=Chryseobacterium lactis TaxID=1241981 RepID=A0A3G6RSW1_CHRLC|nr:glycoside hydrolase family 35 protein [Chryseobacterium lactis]AZA81866.1 beta-galactosidase [Chryseobacterium lactis]AZB06863.1 beta-galactosidase [Chryseobacterium lactis]PNW15716.1 beta-galactosidase [Chryseobacterium lactis]